MCAMYTEQEDKQDRPWGTHGNMREDLPRNHPVSQVPPGLRESRLYVLLRRTVSRCRARISDRRSVPVGRLKQNRECTYRVTNDQDPVRESAVPRPLIPLNCAYWPVRTAVPRDRPEGTDLLRWNFSKGIEHYARRTYTYER